QFHEQRRGLAGELLAVLRRGPGDAPGRHLVRRRRLAGEGRRGVYHLVEARVARPGFDVEDQRARRGQLAEDFLEPGAVLDDERVGVLDEDEAARGEE